jgi:hypothetical protein
VPPNFKTNLHGVGRGSFAQLIADAPQCKAGSFAILRGAQTGHVHVVGSLDLARRYDSLGMKDDIP